MSHDVFISYSTKDKEIADRICSYLDREGITYWIAQRDARPGRAWAESIVNAILESKLVLLIFSSNSNDSRQVHREINVAADEGVSILPFRIENIRPSPELRFFLATPHWLDALPSPNENHFMRLVNSVNTFLSTDSQPTQAADPGKPMESWPENVVAQTGHAEVLKAQGNLTEAAAVYEAPMSIPLSQPKGLADSPPPIMPNQSRPETSSSPEDISTVGLTSQSRILRFLSSLVSYDRFALPGVIEERMFLREKKWTRNTGIGAACCLFVSILWILMTNSSASGIDLTLSGLLILYAVLFMIPGWILAFLAKTPLVYGFISGTLACVSFYTFIQIMNGSEAALSAELLIIVSLASLTILFLLIGTWKKLPMIWIWCGILSIFYSIIGSYDPSYSYRYRFLLFFGLGGIAITIFAVVRSRTFYHVNAKISDIS